MFPMKHHETSAIARYTPILNTSLSWTRQHQPEFASPAPNEVHIALQKPHLEVRFMFTPKKWCRKGPLRLLEDIICLVSLSSVMEKSTVGWSINLSWGACPVRMIWKSIYYWQKGGIMHQQSSPSMLIYQTPHQKPSFSIGWPFILGFFVGVVWHNIGYQGLLRGWKKTARWTSALIKSPRGIFGSCLSDHPGFVCLFCTSSKGWTCCGQLWNFRLLLPGPWKYCTFFIERTSKFPCFWRVHHENHFQQSST